jgi:predicted membrane protein
LVDDLPTVIAASAPRGPLARVSHHTPIGAIKRSGRWRLDRDTEVSTVVGSVKLDLRGAEIGASEVELAVRTVLGSVKVWIPHGVRVEVDGTSMIGSRQVHEDSGSGYPNAPVLRLRVDTLLGSVKVYRV